MNLLKETKEVIESNGRKISDITFIGSEQSGHSCSWDQFKKLADKEYDDGYGTQEVASDLIIVFSDGSKMIRSEYDGAEGWDFHAPFKRPEETKKISNLFSKHGWDSLNTINQ